MNYKDEESVDPLVLRVRGLPWSATKEEIEKFFAGCEIRGGLNGIHMTLSREGRPSGEAFVEFNSPEDADKGLKKNNEHLGNRYIEVFRAKDNEMEWILRKCGLDVEQASGDACVRLRGLPFGCSKEEIAQFFSGLEIVRNGITLPTDEQGRSTGEAYVQFSNQDIAEKAMGKHKEKIGHRYIEIFKSSLQEVRTAATGGPIRMGRSMGPSSRMNPYERPERGGFGRGGMRGRGGRGGSFGGSDRGSYAPVSRIQDTGHCVHLRGLPFRAVERDIFEFFAPVKPIAVRIKYESSGRSSGEADAMFNTHQDAVRAMQKDKEKIQHRYIELFLQSEPEPFSPGMGPYARDGGFENNGGGFNGDREDFGMGAGRGGFGGMGGSRGRGFGVGVGGGFGGGNSQSGLGSSYGAGATGVGAMGRGTGGYGAGAGGRDFGFAQDMSFDDTADSSFGSGGFGASARGGFGGTGARGGSTGMGGYGSTGGYGDAGFRNGSQAGGAMGYGNERSGDSDFYGSGKLFGGNSGQSMGMMPTTYPGY